VSVEVARVSVDEQPQHSLAVVVEVNPGRRLVAVLRHEALPVQSEQRRQRVDCQRLLEVDSSLVKLPSTYIYIYTVSQKKQDTKLLPITSPNVNRFSKFFHW